MSWLSKAVKGVSKVASKPEKVIRHAVKTAVSNPAKFVKNLHKSTIQGASFGLINGKQANNIVRRVSHAGIGAGAGFLTGGPAGAVAGGLYGGLGKGSSGAVNLRSGIRNAYQGGIAGGLAGGVAGLAGYGSMGGPAGSFTGGLFGGTGTGIGGGTLSGGSVVPHFTLGAEGLGVGAGAAAGTGGSMLGGLGGVKTMLAGASILGPMLSRPANPNTESGGIEQVPGNYNFYPGGSSSFNEAGGGGQTFGNSGSMGGGMYSGGFDPNSPQSLQLDMIRKQMDSAGVSPEAQSFQRNQALQGIRGAQADRGMFNSGLGMQQESLLMPQIDQQFQQQRFSNLGSLYSQLNPMSQMAFQGGQNAMDRNFNYGMSNLDKQYGLQRQYNDIASGNVNREDTQNFNARQNYNTQIGNMWNNLGNAGFNYLLK